jgi:predicted dehydrogenase
MLPKLRRGPGEVHPRLRLLSTLATPKPFVRMVRTPSTTATAAPSVCVCRRPGFHGAHCTPRIPESPLPLCYDLAVPDRLRVAVLGAGNWARVAHIPGYERDNRWEVVAVCDPQRTLAEQAAAQFGIPEAHADHEALLGRSDIDVIDVCTPSTTHFHLAWSALEAGKHVLCEKPVAFDFRDTLRARDLARRKGLRTKLGFTFRYSPAMQYMKELIDSGFTGAPYIFNGYEQNSQWIDPETPLRQVDPSADQSRLQLSSLEGYGAPIIDLSHWFVGADLQRVVGTMRNCVPERRVRGFEPRMRINIDDADIFIGEFANGTLTSIQTSYVTVGNYPGLEARYYGSKGAVICRLVEESGVCETLKVATAEDVEFKSIDVPQRFYPPGGTPRESWRSLFYSNLVANFATEILSSAASQGDFSDGAWVQEVINAVELSYRDNRWIQLPLPR